MVDDDAGWILFHTAASNVAIFDDAARAVGVSSAMRHEVRADLLTRAQQAGGVTQRIAEEAAGAMAALTQAGGAVLCTCSTLGPVADHLARQGLQVSRADRILAETAFERGGKLAVIIAAPTTLEPTQHLFAEVGAGISFDLHMVDHAWTRFTAGDLAAYLRLIAACVRRLHADYATIALAQVSMAPVAAMAHWQGAVLDCASSSMRRYRAIDDDSTI